MKFTTRRSLATTLFALLTLVGCAGSDEFCGDDCLVDFGLNRVAIVTPTESIEARPGETVTAEVTVVHISRRYVRDVDHRFTFLQLTRAEPDEPGVHTEITRVDSRPCVAGQVPASILDRNAGPGTYTCTRHLVSVTSAAADVPINLRATFEMAAFDSAGVQTSSPIAFSPPTSRVYVRVSIFKVLVVAAADAHATQATLSVRVERDPGFTGPVTLALDNLDSGIGGTFSPNPVPAGVDTATLLLAIPARYAGGGNPRLRVTGSNAGLEKRFDFDQRIAPLYTVTVAGPGGGPAVLTRRVPLDLDVTVVFDPAGPFARVGPGRIDLSLPDPPPDVRVEWLPDAQPVSADPATLTLRRTLRLTAEGDDGFIGNLEVRATAAQIPADGAGVQPFVSASVPLQLDFAFTWEYVDTSAAYSPVDSDPIGIAMQSTNRPAVAWLEGEGGERKVYLKRFDGTTFLASPGAGARGLSAAGGSIEQARMAMGRDDAAYVAFTYKVGAKEGSGVGFGSAAFAASDWSVFGEALILPNGLHARSPRIAAGRGNDAMALSYLVEQGNPAAAAALLVRSRLLAGTLLVPLPDPARPDGSINASANSQVLRDTPSIALRDDGHPWLAWIEEAFAVPRPPRQLWVRGHDGSRWSAPILVTTRRPLAAKATQLLVEPGSGLLIVAWLEGSPARLMLARVDPATGNYSELRDSANPLDGALNVTTAESASDVALGLDQGRLLVAWTEGPPTRPSLYAKRRNADGSWTRLGAAIDSFRPTRSPFVVGDANTGGIYVTWAGFSGGTDPLSPAPLTDILIGRSVSP